MFEYRKTFLGDSKVGWLLDCDQERKKYTQDNIDSFSFLLCVFFFAR